MTARLGFGVSGPHGARWFSEKTLTRLIAQAIEGGVAHFDTAPFYGEAEVRLARALKAIGACDVFISTKTGTRRNGGRVTKDFSPAAMRADLDASRRRFGRDSIDLLFLHGPSAAEVEPALSELAAMKAAGAVRMVGVCGEGPALDAALAGGADAVMGVFNAADRRHESLFRRARSAGVLVAGIAPLAQGALADPAAPFRASSLWRLARNRVRPAAPAAALAQARRALGTAPSPSLAASALAFVLQSGAVDLAFTTTTSPAHLAEALAAAARRERP
ncbi:MAG: aldo/keto reductase [Parvularculaceae bacterium]